METVPTITPTCVRPSSTHIAFRNTFRIIWDFFLTILKFFENILHIKTILKIPLHPHSIQKHLKLIFLKIFDILRQLWKFSSTHIGFRFTWKLRFLSILKFFEIFWHIKTILKIFLHPHSIQKHLKVEIFDNFEIFWTFLSY